MWCSRIHCFYISRTAGIVANTTKCMSAEAVARSDRSSEKRYYFGNEKVSSQEKSRKVQSIFSNVADKYDFMNDIMSGGIHRLWKDHMVHMLGPTADMKLLDVASGTGDIAFRFLKAISPSGETTEEESISSPLEENAFDINMSKLEGHSGHVVMLDINREMLLVGQQRAKDLGIREGMSCLQGDAQNLPFPDDTFDAYTIAFGIRNVVHIEQALSEAYRVLRPGGRFLCLEFSKVTNPVFERLYDLYSFQVIPVMGQLIARDWKSYQYLVESIQRFPDQVEFSDMIQDAGFNMVSYKNLLQGIAAIHSAYKI